MVCKKDAGSMTLIVVVIAVALALIIVMFAAMYIFTQGRSTGSASACSNTAYGQGVVFDQRQQGATNPVYNAGFDQPHFTTDGMYANPNDGGYIDSNTW